MIKSEWESGMRFGKLLLTGKSYLRGKRRYVECICDCTKVKWIRLDSLKRGVSISCGCAVGERLKRDKPAKTHGLSDNPLYTVYKRMMDRCYDVTHKRYNAYGAVGVEVCPEWKSDFMSFYNWAKDKWQEGLQLDKDILYRKKYRTKTGKLYSPEFCCFVTREENSRTTSRTRYLEYKGESKSLAEWGKELGLKPNTIADRIDKYGFDVEKALSQKELRRGRSSNRWIEAFGERKCLVDWAKDSRCAVTSITFAKRIKRGWEVEKAMTTPSDTKYNDWKKAVIEEART